WLHGHLLSEGSCTRRKAAGRLLTERATGPGIAERLHSYERKIRAARAHVDEKALSSSCSSPDPGRGDGSERLRTRASPTYALPSSRSFMRWHARRRARPGRRRCRTGRTRERGRCGQKLFQMALQDSETMSFSTRSSD